MITRARASALLLGGAALGATRFPVLAAAPKPVPGLQQIEHIVVIYLENRSFDHLYGMFPGADGLANASAAARQIDENGQPYDVLPAFKDRAIHPSLPSLELPPLPNGPFDLGRFMPIDRPLNAAFENANNFYPAQEAINGGKMDKYALIAGSAAMGYYDGRSLPMWQFAQEYVLADRFFQAAFGGTGMNHSFLFCGGIMRWSNAPDEICAHVAADGTLVQDGLVTPDGFLVNNLTSAAAKLVPFQTCANIGTRLDAAGVSWAWYAGGKTVSSQPFNLFENTAPGTSGAKQHIREETAFFDDLKNGVLPQVAIVKPADNEHPKDMGGLLDGDRHCADLVRAVQQSRHWKNSVIIVTYDEGHSFWDHVAPPKVDRWGPGRRIPAIVVSPFAKKSFVDHTTYDTTSILKLIETRFGLQPLGTRDAAAADLTAALNLRV